MPCSQSSFVTSGVVLSEIGGLRNCRFLHHLPMSERAASTKRCRCWADTALKRDWLLAGTVSYR